MYGHNMRLHDYLDRLEVQRMPGDRRETLRRLHLAHRETFLFDNLTIHTGGHISLALGDLERKFLDDGRGGYCFERTAVSRRSFGTSDDPVTLL